jgi:hypothetical protein
VAALRFIRSERDVPVVREIWASQSPRLTVYVPPVLVLPVVVVVPVLEVVAPAESLKTQPG